MHDELVRIEIESLALGFILVKNFQILRINLRGHKQFRRFLTFPYPKEPKIRYENQRLLFGIGKQISGFKFLY